MVFKKVFFKFGVWFKGILILLCEFGICIFWEVIIVGSIIIKCFIFVLYFSVVMLKIVEMEYSGVNSIFL